MPLVIEGPYKPRHRVIRRVTKRDRQRRPKQVKDKKAAVDLLRIRCTGGSRPCSYHACQLGGMIAPGTEYVRVLGPQHEGNARMRWPVSHDYHLWCLPPELRPNLRLLGLTPTVAGR